MQYEKLFRTQSVWKSIFSLAVPSVIIILVMILYNMTDMFFMGQLGDTRQGSGCFRGGSAFFFVSSSGDYVR